MSSSAASIGSNVSVPSSTSNIGAAALRELYGSSAAGPGHPLASLVSQQRFLELSRFGLRHYDLAQHMLTQQGAVTKLLGKFLKKMIWCVRLTYFKNNLCKEIFAEM